jgi:DNA-binding LacI/PurR family transcriptional regulator
VVTIREVAKESGFSSTTVSIVLNNAPLARYIPDATKNRIRRAAHKLGYRPNVFARTLRNQHTRTVGVMVFDMTDPYCTPILRGIECALYQASFLPILTDVHNERCRFERYLEMLLDRRVEALIVVANWLFVYIDVLGDLEKIQYSYCTDRPRAAGRFGQFRHRGQRTGRPSRRRTFVLTGASPNRVSARP